MDFCVSIQTLNDGVNTLNAAVHSLRQTVDSLTAKYSVTVDKIDSLSEFVHEQEARINALITDNSELRHDNVSNDS